MLEKLQNLTNPWNNWKTKTYKDTMLKKDAEKIINLFDNPTELKKYFEENELPQQKESLRALYEGVIERMKVDKKWKNQLNDFIKSERELLKNERFAENLLSVIRKNEIKELAHRLKKELGFEKKIEELIKKYHLEREEYEFLYKALLEILPEREAKILNHNRDMLTIRKDSSILWKEFTHLFDEKKKTYLLKELEEAKQDYERIKALEKNVKAQKQKTEERMQRIKRELEKMESKNSNTSLVPPVQTEVKKEQPKAIQKNNKQIENVYETIATKPSAPKSKQPMHEQKPLVSKKENKNSTQKEKNNTNNTKTNHSSSHVLSGVPLTKVKKEEPVVTLVLEEEKVESKKEITEEKVVQVPVTEEKRQESNEPTTTEGSVSEETPYVASSIPDFGELEGVNQSDLTSVDFDAKNYQDEHEYEIPYGSGGIPSYHDLEEVKEEQHKENNEVNNQEGSHSPNENADPDKDLNDLIWNDKN